MAAWFHNIDSPPMHFAVGMLCSGALWLCVLLVRPRWWLVMPLVMTAGGIWAEGPDIPMAAKYYPSIPGTQWISDQALSTTLHGEWANLFFFHGWLDRSGAGGADRGMAVIIAVYVFWTLVLTVYAHRLRRLRHDAEVGPRREDPAT
ncbi:MAG: hypothetical protein ISS74_08660 [Planctomycetes bacterium]|nr:hypothetical protein [Planctomycetota bacterium]